MNKTAIEIKIVTNWKDRFLTSLSESGRGDKTIQAYCSDLAVFSSWFEQENNNSFNPKFLTSMDLQAFREYSLHKKTVKPATWNRRKAFLSVLSKWARQEGFISYDPLVSVGAAESIQQAPRWLERDEFRRLMRQVELNINSAATSSRKNRAIRDALMVHLMVYAGLREGEVCNLQIGDIEVGERSGRLRVRLGKGEKYREVPLSLEVRTALELWLKLCAQTDGSRPLFGEITERAIQKRIQALGNSACVKDLTPHRLRHTCAKRMLDAGRPLTEVQMILGHAKLETTARYVQPGWADLSAAVASISCGA